MKNLDPPEAFNDRSFYSTHYMDPVMWEPLVRHVAMIHGYECNRIVPGLPGTYPTFVVELNHPPDRSQPVIVVKFFGPLFDGAASLKVEQAMGSFMAHHIMSLRSPAILAEGRLNADWDYLVFEHIPGVSLGEVRQELSTDTLEDVARQIGLFLHELHTLTAITDPIIPITTHDMTWDDYAAFLRTQNEACLSNHRSWQDLPDHMLEQLTHFITPLEQLVDFGSPPHLIHADLTADHLLGRLTPTFPAFSPGSAINPAAAGDMTSSGTGWESLAVIDWGDCRVGNILYELVAIHLDLFHSDKHLLRACLEAYKLPIYYQTDFAHKALSTVLLHQFPMPARIYTPYHDVHSLEELAEGLFGF